MDQLYMSRSNVSHCIWKHRANLAVFNMDMFSTKEKALQTRQLEQATNSNSDHKHADSGRNDGDKT